MFQADTILYDTQKIANYQSDSNFDYLAQIDMPDYSWFELVSRWFNRLINSIFSGKFGENVTTPVLILVFIAIVLSTFYFLYKKRPELFFRNKKTTPIPYTVEEENIHRINFDQEIDSALQCRDYRLAIRLLYLQTLRLFSDKKLIDWQIHKTPTEYLYEITNKDMKPPFRLFTNHFLHVRYGNYQASGELFETMRELQASIKQLMEGGST
jgi:hypothetical protein